MKFEYKIIRNVVADDVEALLNNYAAEGWECMQVDKDYDLNGKTYYSVYFRKSAEESSFVLFKQSINAGDRPFSKETAEAYEKSAQYYTAWKDIEVAPIETPADATYTVKDANTTSWSDK